MNNFEVDNGQWVPTPPTDGWSWGTPTNTSAPPPHSGTKYWGTGVTANYISNAWWKLDLDTTLVVASPTATVEFWYRFDTELNYDGCNFKASVDNGMTWTVLTPTEGAYTVTAAHVANVYLAGQPLWSGHSQTAWEHAVIPIGQFVGQAPDFRFEFASDPIVASYSGFFFDDMVMTGMRPPSAVSGVVRAHVSALPIAGARIWANGQLDTVTTDSTGNYLLPLDAGTYSITFDHRHYCDSTHNNVVVQAGLVTTCNAVLRRPQAQINRTSVTLVTFPGVIVTDTFRISNNGGLCPLDFAITDTSGWLSATPARGTVNPNQYVVITVEADAPVMIGEYTSSLTIVYNALGSPSTLHVDLAIIDAADDPNVIPAGFAYNQNYPNPFNAQTTLCFDVPQLNRVQITIYTILGQEIAHPVDQVYSPGRYRVPYDASALPSGVYLVKMSAASYSQIGKMMLIK